MIMLKQKVEPSVVGITINRRKIGLALSGGGVRGIAHIGVLKALDDLKMWPDFVAGTSVGSIVGAAYCSGMNWAEIADMARSIFWPNLLSNSGLVRLCADYFPATFSSLKRPLIVVATELPSKTAVYIEKGNLATAISASCALRPIRIPVNREHLKLADGGIACVLPSYACRKLGANFVIASDVWERSATLKLLGCHTESKVCKSLYPQHYREAVANTNVLIQPHIPLSSYLPGNKAVEKMINVGEIAAVNALKSLSQSETPKASGGMPHS